MCATASRARWHMALIRAARRLPWAPPAMYPRQKCPQTLSSCVNSTGAAAPDASPPASPDEAGCGGVQGTFGDVITGGASWGRSAASLVQDTPGVPETSLGETPAWRGAGAPSFRPHTLFGTWGLVTSGRLSGPEKGHFQVMHPEIKARWRRHSCPRGRARDNGSPPPAPGT